MENEQRQIIVSPPHRACNPRAKAFDLAHELARKRHA